MCPLRTSLPGVIGGGVGGGGCCYTRAGVLGLGNIMIVFIRLE